MRITLPFCSHEIPEFKIKPVIQEDLDSVIQFSSRCNSFCVGMVDMVNSTAISALLPNSKIINLYSIFLNTMVVAVKRFGGKVVKNVGDSILYYFPDTCDAINSNAIRKFVECGLFMITVRDALNKKLLIQNIPPVNYRVSLDYGNVILAGSDSSSSEDIFGPTVNMCAKINRAASPNTVVAGGDLYILTRHFPYNFTAIDAYLNGLKYSYPVYSVSHKGKIAQTYSCGGDLEDESNIDA